MALPPSCLTTRVHEMLKATSALRNLLRNPIRSAAASTEHPRSLIANAVMLLARNESFEADMAPNWMQNFLSDPLAGTHLVVPEIHSPMCGHEQSTRVFLSHTAWALYCISQIANYDNVMEALRMLQITGNAVSWLSHTPTSRVTPQGKFRRLGDIVLAIGQQCVRLLADSTCAITVSPQGRMVIVSSISVNMTILLRSASTSQSQKAAARKIVCAMQLHTKF